MNLDLHRQAGGSASRFLRAAVVVAASVACRFSPGEKIAVPPQIEAPGQSKSTCSIERQEFLVVEQSTDVRSFLELAFMRGLVAARVDMRDDGCDIEYLFDCEVRGNYSYQGLTRRNDRVAVRTLDELHARLPVGAANLEAELQKGGALNAEIGIVGIYSAPRGRPRGDALSGDCEGATHVITRATVGAADFYTEGSGEIRAGGGIGQLGAGAGSNATRQILWSEGKLAECDKASRDDLRPPNNCGGIIRIQLAALDSTEVPPATRGGGEGAAWVRPNPTSRPRRSASSELEKALIYKKSYNQALAQYHNLELDPALREIDSALSGAGVTDPRTAPLRVLRAVIIFSSTGNALNTSAAFLDAVKADYNVTLPPELGSPDLQKLLAKAREGSGPSPSTGALTSASPTGGEPTPLDDVTARLPDPGSLSPELRRTWARRLFDEALEAHMREDFYSSVIKFEQAYSYAPDRHIFAFNIGQDAWELRDCERVKRYLEHFLRSTQSNVELREKAQTLLRKAEDNPECVTGGSTVPR